MSRRRKGCIRTAAAILACLAAAPSPADDMLHEHVPLLMLSLDRLERRSGDGDPLHWALHAWAGSELRKLWLQGRGERRSGRVEEGELELMYQQAVSAYWDARIGWRADLRPARRDWVSLGVHGLAPWFVGVEAMLFFGESGRTALRVEADYEILFTQRLVLEPRVELHAHGRDDPAAAVGAGVSVLEAELRLRYELTRKLAPYVGVAWWRRYGDTAVLARAAGEDTEDVQLMVGVRAWY